LHLESETEALRTQVAEKERNLKNISTVEFPVFAPLPSARHAFRLRDADLKITSAGVELVFRNGQSETIPCGDLIKVEKVKAFLQPSYDFVIQTKERKRLISTLQNTWTSLRMGSKPVA